jgi:hypothetical protein
VRAMFCAPGRTRTYDRQIRRLLLYPLSYGGQEHAVRARTAGSRITVAPDLSRKRRRTQNTACDQKLNILRSSSLTQWPRCPQPSEIWPIMWRLRSQELRIGRKFDA